MGCRWCNSRNQLDAKVRFSHFLEIFWSLNYQVLQYTKTQQSRSAITDLDKILFAACRIPGVFRRILSDTARHMARIPLWTAASPRGSKPETLFTRTFQIDEGWQPGSNCLSRTMRGMAGDFHPRF
jgi:hypothetical protein